MKKLTSYFNILYSNDGHLQCNVKFNENVPRHVYHEKYQDVKIIKFSRKINDGRKIKMYYVNNANIILQKNYY